MSEWLTQFKQSTDPRDIVTAAVNLRTARDSADVPALLSALKDPLEDRRWGTVYALGGRDDPGIIAALIHVLLNRQEIPRVRGQAAEHLGYDKALEPLIECSADPSPNVRFWCVFALGSYRRHRHHRVRRRAIRALKARLDDHAIPEIEPLGWTVGLEALAMLRSSDPHYRHTRAFRDTIARTLNDPLGHPEHWQ